MSDEELAEVEAAMARPMRQDHRADLTILLAEVRRLRELVEAAVKFHIGELVVRAEDGNWQAYTPWLEDGVDEVFPTRDEALAYARERSGR